MEDYKRTKSFVERKNESDRIRRRYPDRIPCYIVKQQGSQMQKLDKNKFLVPDDFGFSQIIHIVRNRIRLLSHEGLYLLVNGNYAISPQTMMRHVYSQYKDEDGMLYIVYSSENTFGYGF